MCKVYFASSVMKYAPHRFAGTPALHAYIESYLEPVDKYNVGRVAISLDIFLHMRRSCYYISGGHNSDGQTRTARSKDAGTKTHQHSQSTPRSRYRSSVQREPVLRSQRSSPGPLRNAAAAQHRGDVDSGCGRCLWSLPAHVLSGAECFQPGWPGWIIARSTWSQGWPQGDDRCSRVRSEPEVGRAGSDHCPVHSSGSGTLRNYDPPAQSRAGAGTRQKKTPRPDLNASFAAATAETYEALRPHLVDPTGQHGATAGRAVLLRHGMIAWATTLNQAPTSPVTVRPPTLPATSSDIATELIRFIASLILNSGKDRCYA
jgi:hypothetical protein